MTDTNSLPQLTAGRPYVTDGGLETTLVFRDGIDLPDFAAFPLLDTEPGRAALVRYYTPYFDLAERLAVGMVVDTPTWRANLDWGARLGYDAVGLAAVNRRAVEFVSELAGQRTEVPTVINGVIGPRGDGYVISATMSPSEAAAYHGLQARSFAEAGAEMISAITMTYADEAIGVARAASAVGLPVVISLTVETDALLPSGQAIGDAITQIDDATTQHARVLHGELRPPDPLLRGPRPDRTVDRTDPWDPRQRLASQPRRARCGDRAGPRRHRRTRRPVRRSAPAPRPPRRRRLLRHRPRARRRHRNCHRHHHGPGHEDPMNDEGRVPHAERDAD